MFKINVNDELEYVSVSMPDFYPVGNRLMMTVIDTDEGVVKVLLRDDDRVEITKE